MARILSRVGVPLLILGVLAAYTWRLDRQPPSLYIDEVVFALQAHAIATTGHDLSGRRLPLYFQMRHIGETSWFHPAIVYATAALFVAGLPVTEFVVRLPTVLVAILDVVLVYFIGRRLFAARWPASLAAALLALTPAHIMHARMAMDFLYPVPFMLAWLLALLGYIQAGRTWRLFVATSALGIGVYSYIAAVMLMPIYLVLTLATLWGIGHRKMRPYLVACAGFAWPLALLAAWLSQYPEVVSQTLVRYGLSENAATSAGWDDLTGRLSLYWRYFDPAYLFVTGGLGHMFSTTRRVGALLLPMALLVPAGLVTFAAGAAPTQRLILLGFFTAPLAACGLPEPYALDRHLVLLPFAALLAAAGAERLRHSPPPWRRAGAIALCLVPLHFAFFQYDYWVDYPARAAYRYQGNRRAALGELIARADAHPAAPILLNQQRVPYVRAHWEFYLLKHARPDLLERTRYYEQATALSHLPAGSLVLTTVDDETGRGVAGADVETFPEAGNPPVLALMQLRE